MRNVLLSAEVRNFIATDLLCLNQTMKSENMQVLFLGRVTMNK